MTNLEMINDLIERQKTLDSAFLKEMTEKQKERFTKENIKLALLDELGEVNHEYKAKWCWWKKTQKEVDREKLLEELADVWHFSIMLHYRYSECNLSEDFIGFCCLWGGVSTYPEVIRMLLSELNEEYIIYNMTKFTYSLNFSIKDVYNAYIKKDEENYNRIKNGY